MIHRGATTAKAAGSRKCGQAVMLDRALVEGLTRAVADAAEAIVAIGRDAIDVRTKSNATPVTAADERSQSLLVEAVARLMPGVDVVAEEMASLPALPGDPFVLIDPLDGTKEYVAGSSEYTVNLAVVAGGRPVAGFLAVPAAATHLPRRVRPRGRAAAPRRRPDRGCAADPDPGGAPGRARRDGQPLPSRSANGGPAGTSRGDDAAPVRLGAQVLPGRRGGGGHLPAPRHHLRMGRGRRPRARRGGRRDGHRAAGRAASATAMRRRTTGSMHSSPGATPRWCRSRRPRARSVEKLSEIPALCLPRRAAVIVLPEGIFDSGTAIRGNRVRVGNNS